MKIKNVELSILRTELGQEVIPTKGAVDKMPQPVLVSVSTDEGIDGHYISPSSRPRRFSMSPRSPKRCCHGHKAMRHQGSR